MFNFFAKQLSREVGGFADIKTLAAVSIASKQDYANFHSAWMMRFDQHFGRNEDLRKFIGCNNPATFNWQRGFKEACEIEYGKKYWCKHNRLIFAAADGNLAVIMELENEIPHDRGAMLFLLGAARNQPRVCDYLYKKLLVWNPPVDSTEFLYHAIYCYQPLSVIAGFLDQGADVNRRTEGLTAFGHAIHAGNLEAVKYLMDRYNIDIHQPDEFHGAPWLILAAHFYQEDIVRYFLQCGADVNVVLTNTARTFYQGYLYFNRDTALDEVIGCYAFPIGKILIDAGAKVTLKQFMMAINSRDVAIIKYFIDNFPEYIDDIDMERKGQTPLVNYLSYIEHDRRRHNDSSCDKDYYVVYKLFREHGVNLLAHKDVIENQYLLYYATLIGDIRIVRDMIEQGVSIQEARYRGESIFHIAAHDNRIDILEYYIKHCQATLPDWDINMYTAGYGSTILHSLFANGSIRNADHNILRLLLENGANPDIFPWSALESSPLYMAIIHKEHAVANLLLSYNAQWDRDLRFKDFADPIKYDAYRVALSAHNPYMVRKYLAGRMREVSEDDAVVDRRITNDSSAYMVFRDLASQILTSMDEVLMTPPPVAYDLSAHYRLSKLERELQAVTALMRVMVHLETAASLGPHLHTLQTMGDNGSIYRQFCHLPESNGINEFEEVNNSRTCSIQ